MQRIVVMGYCCAGKTTLAKKIAAIMKLPHIELDTLRWKKGWQAPPLDELYMMVKQITAKESWIIDGNGGEARNLILNNATCIIWLNYPKRLVMFRALKRSFSRMICGKMTPSGDYETLKHILVSPHSALIHTLFNYRKRRHDLRNLFNSHHGICLEIRSPKETKELLNTLKGCSRRECKESLECSVFTLIHPRYTEPVC